MSQAAICVTDYNQQTHHFESGSVNGFVSRQHKTNPKKVTPINQARSSARLQTLLNALPAGVVVVNGKGVVEEANPVAERLLQGKLIGARWLDVITRSFNPTPSGQDMMTIKGQIVNISTCPLDEHMPGQIVLLHDVTQTRQLQAKVAQQQRLASMGQMAAQLAHQIRTPISSLLLYASHLQKSNISQQHRLKFANRIVSQVKSLEKLVRDMLLFSRDGMDQADYYHVQDILDYLAGQCSKQAQIEYQFTNTIVSRQTILANRDLLVSALMNLVENAEQAVAQVARPRIEVVVMQEQTGFVDFVIKDNGQGIDPQDVQKIYQPFFTTKSKGTGLGLAVVKAISQSHQGELFLRETSEQGSSFVLRLPVIET